MISSKKTNSRDAIGRFVRFQQWFDPFIAMAAVLLCDVVFAGPVIDLELAARYQNNLSRSERPQDRQNDAAVVVGARVVDTHRLSPQSQWFWKLGAMWTQWTEFSDLSQFAGDAALGYRYQFGTHFEAPWLLATITGTGLAHIDSDIRDGGKVRGALIGGRRFGHRFATEVGYTYEVRRAIEDEVFDTEQHRVFGQLDYTISPRWLSYSSVGVVDGDVVSVSVAPWPKAMRVANAITRDFDGAFGSTSTLDGSPGRRPRWAYQLDAVVLTGEVGVNYLLKPGLVIDASANYAQANGEGDNKYNTYGVNLSLLFQF